MPIHVFLNDQVLVFDSWWDRERETIPPGTYAVNIAAQWPDGHWWLRRLDQNIWDYIELKDVPSELKLKVLLLT